tara:strand:+ start:1436 stop:1672 length:237 start_codon:yes stop_codon:yes gene_type:complete
MSKKNKKKLCLSTLITKVEKMDLTCGEIRDNIAKLRETLGEPDEICPDEVESEKALRGMLEEMVMMSIAENTTDKGEA